MKLYKTTDKLISEDYPYGWNLRTTKYDYLEFMPNRGFRHVSYTINPKTGRENKPKKGTYCEILLLGKDENNYTKSLGFTFYNNEEKDKTIAFLSNPENFALFTPEQIEYIYIKLYHQIRLDIQASSVYCNANPIKSLEIQKPIIEIVKKGLKSKGLENVFPEIKFDWEAIDALDEKGFQPFKMTEYGI
jgi:hypothetical protein